MALAAALDVSPVTLLMPESATREDLVEVTGRPPEQAGAVWDRLRALYYRTLGDLSSLVRSNPPWALQGGVPSVLVAAVHAGAEGSGTLSAKVSAAGFSAEGAV